MSASLFDDCFGFGFFELVMWCVVWCILFISVCVVCWYMCLIVPLIVRRGRLLAATTDHLHGSGLVHVGHFHHRVGGGRSGVGRVAHFRRLLRRPIHTIHSHVYCLLSISLGTALLCDVVVVVVVVCDFLVVLFCVVFVLCLLLGCSLVCLSLC